MPSTAKNPHSILQGLTCVVTTLVGLHGFLATPPPPLSKEARPKPLPTPITTRSATQDFSHTGVEDTKEDSRTSGCLEPPETFLFPVYLQNTRHVLLAEL